MKLPCHRCSSAKEPVRHHVGPYKDRSTGEWIARCSHCGGGQVVDAPSVQNEPLPPETALRFLKPEPEPTVGESGIWDLHDDVPATKEDVDSALAKLEPTE